MANTLVITQVAEGLFEHVLNSEQATSDNSPNLTTFRNIDTGVEWLDFKSKNGAPLVSKQRILPQEITIADTFGGTGTFTGFTNALGIWLKLAELGYFVGYGIEGGSGGVNRFIELLDVYPPLTYFGQDGKVSVVNEAQNRMDFTEFYNKRLFSELDDVATGTLNSGMNGKLLQISIVMGEPKITLLNIPALSDSLKQTYKIRLDKTDAPDDVSVLEKLQTYSTDPFTDGIVPNDMGGIIVEVYDFALSEVFAIYEIVDFTAGNNLVLLTADNLIKFGAGSGGGSVQSVTGSTVDNTDPTNPVVNVPTLQDVTNEGSSTDTTIEMNGASIKTETYTGGIFSSDLTNARVYELPDQSGTIALTSDIATKQDTLVSGTNIKTLEGVSLIGSGNLEITNLIMSLSFGQQVYLHVGQPGAFLNSIGAPMQVVGTSDPIGPTYAPIVGANSFTKMVRTRMVSAATALSSAGFTQGSHRVFDNELATSFYCSVRFGNEDTATVANARNAIGFGVDPGNTQNPSAQTNIFCIGNDSGDTNLQIIYNGGGGVVKVDLGSNFPANTNSLDNYLFEFWKEKGSSAISYKVYNYHNQQTVSGSAPSNTPVAGGYYTFLRRNNGTTALAVRLSINHFFMLFNQQQ